MKRLFFFSTLFFLLLTISACNHELEKPASKVVKGEWQWMYSTGGVGGYSLEPINSTLITLSLNSDSTYVFYSNNEVELQGRYSIKAVNNTSILHLDHRVQINMLSMQPDQAIITWNSSQLQLLDNSISDGFKHYFKKIK